MRARLSAAALFTSFVGTVACSDVSWPSDRIVTSLRILGVRAEPASLAPDQSSRLSLLCADGINGGASDPTCRDIEVAWFAGCNNPENNDPLRCLEAFDAASGVLNSPLSATPASSQFAVAPNFEFLAPSDILQRSVDVGGFAVNYGVSFVYFVACAGKLYPINGVSDRLPVECRDPITGTVLDQRRTVVGYTTIYSYDAIANENPTVDDIRFDGETLTNSSCNVDADCGVGFGCTSTGACAPSTQHCDRSTPQSCVGHCIDFQMPAQSFALHTRDGTAIINPLKSVWAETYANVGRLPDDARFGIAPPKDAETPIRSICAPWQAPQLATEEARVWIVVRDDRGGLSWIEQRVLVR